MLFIVKDIVTVFLSSLSVNYSQNKQIKTNKNTIKWNIKPKRSQQYFHGPKNKCVVLQDCMRVKCAAGIGGGKEKWLFLRSHCHSYGVFHFDDCVFNFAW